MSDDQQINHVAVTQQVEFGTQTIIATGREVKYLFLYDDRTTIRIEGDGRALINSTPADDTALGWAIRQFVIRYAQAYQQKAPGD